MACQLLGLICERREASEPAAYHATVLDDAEGLVAVTLDREQLRRLFPTVRVEGDPRPEEEVR